MSNDLEMLFMRYVPLDEEANPVDLDKQIAKFRAVRKAEQQNSPAAQREAKRQAKLAKVTERERLKGERARVKAEKAAARAAKLGRPGPRQIDLLDLINEL
jgi:hypothetical protein